MRRGEIWWIDFGEPSGPGPGFRRPCLIVSSNRFNEGKIRTVIVATITFQLHYETMQGCFRLPAKGTGLQQSSIVNLAHLTTVDKRTLKQRIGAISQETWKTLDDALHVVLGLAT